jgi:hypothetical protein
VSDKAFGDVFWAITHFYVRHNLAADKSAAYPLETRYAGYYNPKSGLFSAQ